MKVTGMTVSLKVNDVEYGRGSERFVSLRADTPVGELGVELDDFQNVLEKVLALNLQTWESVQASRFSGGVIGSEEFKKLVEGGRRRTERVTNYLNQRGNDATDPEPA